MVIKYKPKRLRNNLILGLMWLIFGVIFFLNEESFWMDYGYLVISILYLGIYFYERKNQYLTLLDGQLKKNSLFGKKIDLKEVTEFRSFAGEYIFKSEDRKMKIDTQVIAEESFKELNEELENYDFAGIGTNKILKNTH